MVNSVGKNTCGSLNQNVILVFVENHFHLQNSKQT